MSPTDAWAVGEGWDEGEGHTVGFATRWDGVEWTDAPIEEVGDASGLLATDAVSPADAWAVGYTAMSGSTGMVSRALIERWDGTAWSVVNAPLPDPSPNMTTVLTDVLALAPDNAWAVGRWAPVVDAPPSPLILHWDGASWTVVDAPVFENWTELTGIAGSGPNDVWVVGNTEVFVEQRNAFVERALIEHWNGNTFEVLDVPHNRRKPLTVSNLDEAAAISPTDAWAVGSLTRRDGTSVNLTYHWDGEEWKRVDVPSPSETLQYLSGVAGLSPERVWAVGRYRDNGTDRFQTFVARWNGERWRRMSSESRQNHSVLHDVTALPGWTFAVGSSWSERGGGRYRTLGLEERPDCAS